MSHDTDKEMDLLLRRHARRNASGLADVSAKSDAQHMDADELSAYAEGALSQAERSRYVLHLADCDSCRKTVTELLISSGVEAKESGTVAQSVETPSRSWREWLAALFSPPVLRYAAPALALVAFASIIFVVITRNREIPSLARRQAETEQTSSGDEKQQNQTPSNAGTSNSASANQPAPLSAGANNAGPVATSPATQGRETGTTSSAETDGYKAPDAPKAADTRGNAAPPPSPSLQESTAESKQTQQPAQVAPPVDKAAEAGKLKDNPGFINQNRRESSNATLGGAAAAGSGRRSQSTEAAKSGPTQGAMTDGTGGERQKKETPLRSTPATTAARARRDASGADEESSATRTVAGKRFRQQNGVWVDSAYNSSRSLTRVRRGSEQYRALVADEPIVGTVSNSLGGALIVVAGGRAYHIY